MRIVRIILAIAVALGFVAGLVIGEPCFAQGQFRSGVSVPWVNLYDIGDGRVTAATRSGRLYFEDGELKIRGTDGSVTVVGEASSGVSDGDKGDITVSGSGATWNVDSGAIGAGELADNLSCAANEHLARNSGDNGWDCVAESAGGSAMMHVTFHADATANSNQTDQTGLQQLSNNARSIMRADLSDFTEMRIVARVVAGSASANNPRLVALYSTSFTTTVASFSDIGASGEVSASIEDPGFVTSAWSTIAAGALGDVYLTIGVTGGDGAADPSVGNTAMQFR